MLVRGLPGAGKSTWAANQLPEYCQVEADQFWGPEYRYDRNLTREAHEWARLEALRWLHAGEPVVVCNTFVTRGSMAPYLKLGYPVRIVEVRGDFESVHNVPQSVIDGMAADWEVAPEGIQVDTVENR